jgi:hypothetical protein
MAAAGALAGGSSLGPITYPGMTIAVDAEGASTPGYAFTNDVQKPTPWRAHWIWGGTGDKNVLFRREVVLSQAPQKVAAWVSADRKYRLYVNGQLVSRGPVDIGTDFVGGSTRHWFYDTRDLTSRFTAGTNVIAVEVFSDWPIGYTISRGNPGLILEAEATLPDGRVEVIQTDAQWLSLPAPQYSGANVYRADREPSGWRDAGFPVNGWSAAREVADIWSPLVPSEMPPLMESDYPALRVDGLPESRLITSNTTFRVVFDRVLSAYPFIKVKGGKGAHLAIRGTQSAEMILGGGEGVQSYEFPFLAEIAPVLTIEAKDVTTPVEIIEVGAHFTSQPVDYRGAFECNDEFLNRVWKVSRWAVQICMQTHHLDSPNHQEPISDPGDYVIESMISHYAFGQPWLARQDVRKFAWILKDEKYANFHISYSIGWVQMLLDYYDYTGDDSLVREMAPYVHELMDTYATWRGTNGLISEAPNYMFMDWVQIAGFNCHHPPAVIGQGYLTAFYYHGMDMASRVAVITGDSARADMYSKRRAEIAEAFNRELWVDAKGLYRDGKPFQTHVKPSQWLPEDKAIETFSPHVNLLAVLYDLAPGERHRDIVNKILAEPQLNTQPWFMHWVFQSMDHAGLFERYGTAQMRRWKIVPETQSFREMWNDGDLSHGWCSTPLVQMSARILGLMPAEPGWKRIAIRPHLCDLQWARGAVPTPFGLVKVSWKLEETRWTLDTTIPAGARAEVFPPLERFEAPAPVLCDGQKVEGRIELSAGSHHIEITGKLKPVP